MPIPFLIPAIAALAGGIISAVSSSRQTKKTNEANLELAKYSYQQQKEQIREQNRYNSPAMQMSRFSDAGLNPNLIYGQGNPGNQQSIPQFQPPRQDWHYKPFDLPGVLEQYNNLAMQRAQTDNVKASTEATRAATANKVFDRLISQLKLKRGEFDLRKLEQLLPYDTQMRMQQADQSIWKSQSMAEQFRQMKGMNPLLLEEKYNKVRMQQSEAQKKEADALYAQLKAQMFKNQSMTPSDNIVLRLLVHALQGMDIDVNQEKILKDLHIER